MSIKKLGSRFMYGLILVVVLTALFGEGFVRLDLGFIIVGTVFIILGVTSYLPSSETSLMNMTRQTVKEMTDVVNNKTGSFPEDKSKSMSPLLPVGLLFILVYWIMSIFQ